jgi:hypothetical protein
MQITVPMTCTEEDMRKMEAQMKALPSGAHKDMAMKEMSMAGT